MLFGFGPSIMIHDRSRVVRPMTASRRRDTVGMSVERTHMPMPMSTKKMELREDEIHHFRDPRFRGSYSRVSRMIL